jgi:glycosyltransferase involved in cell wall biosynthesis
MVEVMRRVQPDIVHLVTIKPVLLGGIAARLARVPALVAAVSGLGYFFMARGIRAALGRAAVRTAYRLALGHPNASVIFQNRDDMAVIQEYASLAPGKAELIRGSGVNLREFHPVAPPPGGPVVLMAARLLADKGVHEFVAAARELHGHAGARFVLAGDIDPGNPTSLTREGLDRLVADGIVEWWGHRHDMPQVLGQASIVVLPSYREGLPKVLIEAAACGKAIVTTDVPGCRDAITAGETGLLVPARDSAALAAALRGLLESPETCNRMGAAGRQLAESAFDIGRVVSRHLEIYESKMARAAGAVPVQEN